jgi:hypothetical protein
MVVLQFVQREQESSTVQTLRDLLTHADNDEIEGLALCYRDHMGQEEVVFTGYFKENISEALRACLQASVLLNKLNEGCPIEPDE